MKLREVRADPAGREQLTFNDNFSPCRLIRFVNRVQVDVRSVLLKSLGPNQAMNLLGGPILAFHICFFSFF